MPDAHFYKRMKSWLLQPAQYAGTAGGALGVVYAAFELHFPKDSWISLGVIVLVTGIGGSLFARLLQSRGLDPLGRLAEEGDAPTRESLGAAVQAVAGAPDRAFWVGLALWFFSALIIGITYAAVPGVPFGTGLRMMFLGLAFGPASSLLGYLLVLPRARAALTRLSAMGLSPSDLTRLVPARPQMRLRLFVFASAMVMTPCVLIAELAVHHATVALDEVASTADPAERERLAHGITSDQLIPTVVLIGMTFAVVVIAARAAGRALDEPMQAMSDQARRIAQGDLSEISLVWAEDELWAASSAFGAMQSHLSGVLRHLKRAGLKISTTTEQIVQMSSRHSQTSSAQAAALNETVATTEELARSARQIADNAGQVARIAEETLAAARLGGRNAQTFAESMSRMKRDNQGIADSVVRLNKRVQQIGKIVEFINGIADKSDLLALNAELEGTKAGDLGRGFSLVAAEMRRIAENVLDSTRQIARLIEEIRDATNAAVMATEAGVKATDSGSLHAVELSKRLLSIVDLASATSDAIRAISLATQQQQAGTDQLALAMANVLQVTQQSAQQTKQLSQANSDLVSLAGDLKVVVERFRVE